MGRKERKLNKAYLRKKRLTQTPRLPPELKRALKERGVELPSKITSHGFYKKLGLQINPNADAKTQLGFHDKLAEVKANVKKPQKEEEMGNSEIFQEAADSIPHGPGYQKHLNDYEIKCISQLRAFYGDDLQMMAYDYRRNPMQWSVGQLREKIAIYENTAALLESKADELASDGEKEE
ncbi:hypothetical protein GPJ56_001797 [Histomonas meleagridis]|uniref:uncharacterized protein n=1 Tax=Histomonas meleagridis TaxID=135588 RepID=UPI00355A3042|nr:hypothetical protein GPJ56_001797 [Histomonas meleagridis]KAH0803266.1 hypothetical protein GO595_004002 [Histomonas meleagridis]